MLICDKFKRLHYQVMKMQNIGNYRIRVEPDEK